MGKAITTNKARKILAREFEVNDFNVIGLKDIQKFFKKVDSKGDVSFWEPKAYIVGTKKDN